MNSRWSHDRRGAWLSIDGGSDSCRGCISKEANLCEGLYDVVVGVRNVPLQEDGSLHGQVDECLPRDACEDVPNSMSEWVII